MTQHDTIDARIFAMELQLVARVWRAKTDAALSGLRLSTTLAYPIMAVHRLGEGVRQTVVANALGIEGPSLVRALDALGAAGLLDRREDLADRRAKTLHLTPEGKRLARHIETVVARVREDLLAGISSSDLAATARTLQSIARAAGVSLAAPIALADFDGPSAVPEASI
ncbi:MAG: MarR family transcriptional regulator [Beijerinckiaceae bacterium]|nr:MarR family transcriptional regulator [Beijerinckiaceae bacterium]